MLMLGLVGDRDACGQTARASLRYTRRSAFLGVGSRRICSRPAITIAQYQRHGMRSDRHLGDSSSSRLAMAGSGEDSGWRLWLATIVAASATAAAFAFLRTTSNEDIRITLIGEDPCGITHEAAAFLAPLIRHRDPPHGRRARFALARGVLMLTERSCSSRSVRVRSSHTRSCCRGCRSSSLLAGAFLIVNERAVRETVIVERARRD